MKKIIFLSLFFYSVSMSAQEKISCEDFSCVTEKIENFIQNAEYESALKILLAADAFDDHDKEKIDDMFQNLFDAIQQERDKAVQMADELTISLERQETLQKKIADDKEGRIISMTDDLLSKVRNERKSKRYEIALLDNEVAERLIIDSIGDYSENLAIRRRMDLIHTNKTELKNLIEKQNLYEGYISEAKELRAKGVKNYGLALDNLISADSLNIVGMEAHNMIENITTELENRRNIKDLSSEEYDDIMARVYFYKRDTSGIKTLARKNPENTYFSDKSPELKDIFQKTGKSPSFQRIGFEVGLTWHQNRQTLWNKNNLAFLENENFDDDLSTMGGSIGLNYFTKKENDIFSIGFKWFEDTIMEFKGVNENKYFFNGSFNGFDSETNKLLTEYSTINELNIKYSRKLFNSKKFIKLSSFASLELGSTLNSYPNLLMQKKNMQSPPSFLSGFSALIKSRGTLPYLSVNYDNDKYLIFGAFSSSREDLTSFYACQNYIIESLENNFYTTLGLSFKWEITKKPIISIFTDIQYRLPILSSNRRNELSVRNTIFEDVKSHNILDDGQLEILNEYYSQNCNHDISIGLQKENLTYDRLNITAGFAFRFR